MCFIKHCKNAQLINDLPSNITPAPVRRQRHQTLHCVGWFSINTVKS